MSESEDTISTFFMILSHPLRRLIIEALFEMKEVTFSELLRMFFVDNSTLNFHLKKLDGLIKQLPNKKYTLTEMGQKAAEILRELKSATLQSKVQSFQETVELLLAPTKKRILAGLIDFLIGFGVFVLLPLIFAPLRWSLESLVSSPERNLLFLVLFWFYLTLLEGFSGQSLGKVFMQIKVVRVDGKKLTYDRVAIRNFGKIFLLPVDLLLAHYFLKEKMYLRYFDKFAGTTVIEAIQ
jgi:uncharacterized RDD family membrane protein YckC/DNA-binding HxlR family transcriptional regulator